MMAGMYGNKTHLAGVNPLTDPFHQSIVHFTVSSVTPPYQNVGVVQHFVRQTLIRIVQSGQSDFQILAFGEKLTDYGVKTVGVDSPDSFAFLFVTEFVPDHNVQFLCRHDNDSPLMFLRF
jgi:hypothetical protein